MLLQENSKSTAIYNQEISHHLEEIEGHLRGIYFSLEECLRELSHLVTYHLPELEKAVNDVR
jgi:hypothetical protein